MPDCRAIHASLGDIFTPASASLLRDNCGFFFALTSTTCCSTLTGEGATSKASAGETLT